HGSSGSVFLQTTTWPPKCRSRAEAGYDLRNASPSADTIARHESGHLERERDPGAARAVPRLGRVGAAGCRVSARAQGLSGPDSGDDLQPGGLHLLLARSDVVFGRRTAHPARLV